MSEKISSVLIDAASKLVKSNQSSASMRKTQSSFEDFLRFMEIGTANLKSIEFNKNKLNKLESVNVTNTFGNAGNLLSGLFSGALDLGSFVGDFFGGGQRNKPASPRSKPPKPIPKGPRIRFPGIRGLPILSTLFAGIDFSERLSAGQSTAQAATGAGGAAVGAAAGGLAGVAIAGAIGQTFVPIPGLGFVLGAALGTVGGMAGGNLADTAYKKVTGEGEKTAEQVTTEKVREQSRKQLEASAARQQEPSSFSTSLDKFDSVIKKFEQMSYSMFAAGVNAAASSFGSEERMLDYGLDPEALPPAPETITGQLQDVSAEGGKIPSSTSITSGYGWRWGRMHRGIDYGLPTGTPVSLIQPGKVTYARFNDGGYGNLVEVSHPGGTSTLYAHLNSISVREGQQIESGTVIGTVGSTGRSTGPHLHFEIRSGGNPIKISNVDGDKYFRFGGNVKVKPKPNNTNTPSTLTPNSSTENKVKPQQLVNQTTSVTNQRNANVASVQTNRAIPPTSQTPISTPETRNVVPAQNIVPVPQMMSSVPQQYQVYPSYNQIQSMMTIMPIIPPTPSQQSAPIIISGSGTNTVIMPGPDMRQVSNSIMNNMLLTNLSST